MVLREKKRRHFLSLRYANSCCWGRLDRAETPENPEPTASQYHHQLARGNLCLQTYMVWVPCTVPSSLVLCLISRNHFPGLGGGVKQQSKPDVSPRLTCIVWLRTPNSGYWKEPWGTALSPGGSTLRAGAYGFPGRHSSCWLSSPALCPVTGLHWAAVRGIRCLQRTPSLTELYSSSSLSASAYLYATFFSFLSDFPNSGKRNYCTI